MHRRVVPCASKNYYRMREIGNNVLRLLSLQQGDGAMIWTRGAGGRDSSRRECHQRDTGMYMNESR